MTECSTPPDGDVEWEVRRKTIDLSGIEHWTRLGVYMARTAFAAHRQCVMAPAYGCCRVRRYFDPDDPLNPNRLGQRPPSY